MVRQQRAQFGQAIATWLHNSLQDDSADSTLATINRYGATLPLSRIVDTPEFRFALPSPNAPEKGTSEYRRIVLQYIADHLDPADLDHTARLKKISRLKIEVSEPFSQEYDTVLSGAGLTDKEIEKVRQFKHVLDGALELYDKGLPGTHTRQPVPGMPELNAREVRLQELKKLPLELITAFDPNAWDSRPWAYATIEANDTKKHFAPWEIFLIDPTTEPTFPQYPFIDQDVYKDRIAAYFTARKELQACASEVGQIYQEYQARKQQVENLKPYLEDYDATLRSVTGDHLLHSWLDRVHGRAREAVVAYAKALNAAYKTDPYSNEDPNTISYDDIRDTAEEFYRILGSDPKNDPPTVVAVSAKNFADAGLTDADVMIRHQGIDLLAAFVITDRVPSVEAMRMFQQRAVLTAAASTPWETVIEKRDAQGVTNRLVKPTGNGGRVVLFETAVPEQEALLAQTMLDAFPTADTLAGREARRIEAENFRQHLLDAAALLPASFSIARQYGQAYSGQQALLAQLRQEEMKLETNGGSGRNKKPGQLETVQREIAKIEQVQRVYQNAAKTLSFILNLLAQSGIGQANEFYVALEANDGDAAPIVARIQNTPHDRLRGPFQEA